MSKYLYSFMESMTESCEEVIRVFEEGVSILMGLTKGDVESDLSSSTSTGNSAGTSNDYVVNDDMIIGEDEDISGMKSPLDGIAEGVLEDILQNQAKPVTMKESFDAFRSAITWSEPFIIGIITFQVVMLFSTLFVTKRCGMGSGLVFLTILAVIVRSAEWLNQYGAKNWESFATQNYFDERGIFISIMMSAPLLFMAFYMLISYLREASSLLVKVKKQELKKKQMQRQNKGTNKKDKKKGSKKDD